MLRDRGGSERGSVAITVALSLTLLLAFAALVVDVGLNWAARTSAQTAADSAALAGASTLLLDGPGAAFDTVETFLSNNQVTLPAAAGWADDGVVSNGEVVCWTMPDDPPDPPPGPGLNCPDGSNALQVITPPPGRPRPTTACSACSSRPPSGRWRCWGPAGSTSPGAGSS
jgi:hypothetical protein